MKKQLISFSMLLVTCTSLISAQLFQEPASFTIGPLHIQFNDGNFGTYFVKNKGILDNPICYGITHHKAIVMLLIIRERISNDEIKFTTKRLVVEPYAFAVTKDLEPILEGNITEEVTVKHVITKYVDEPMQEELQALPLTYKSVAENPIKQNPSFFKKWFSSDSTVIQKVDIRDVVNIQVLDDRLFTPDKEYKGFSDENLKVICQID